MGFDVKEMFGFFASVDFQSLLAVEAYEKPLRIRV
jgi:hypothetical protein